MDDLKDVLSELRKLYGVRDRYIEHKEFLKNISRLRSGIEGDDIQSVVHTYPLVADSDELDERARADADRYILQSLERSIKANKAGQVAQILGFISKRPKGVLFHQSSPLLIDFIIQQAEKMRGARTIMLISTMMIYKNKLDPSNYFGTHGIIQELCRNEVKAFKKSVDVMTNPRDIDEWLDECCKIISVEIDSELIDLYKVVEVSYFNRCIDKSVLFDKDDGTVDLMLLIRKVSMRAKRVKAYDVVDKIVESAVNLNIIGKESIIAQVQ